MIYQSTRIQLMTVKEVAISKTETEEFQTGEVSTISFAHFINDVYTAQIAPLLPVLIDKLSISLTAAGGLSSLVQLPALINPFIGHMADKVSLRWFVILAPAITGTLISFIGTASTPLELALILFVAGISGASFHAPAPAMIARISGKQVGKGMSFFMASGELARTIGPLLAVWAVSYWTLEGMWRLAILGWASSILLYWRLRKVPARPDNRADVRTLIPSLRTVFLPLSLIIFFRNFLNVSLTTYLPMYMSVQGASLLIAGAALSVLEVAGVAGALLSGTFSDKIGRKPILIVATIGAAAMMLFFLNAEGWILVPILLVMGFAALSTTPVLLAIVQENAPNNRALANGLFISIAFLIRPISLLVIGYLGDMLGLQNAFLISAGISLLALVPIVFIPQ
jgi:FSR family fosmidomycin resistance protein-like MFS transporter